MTVALWLSKQSDWTAKVALQAAAAATNLVGSQVIQRTV
jgi:hypothetical protein